MKTFRLLSCLFVSIVPSLYAQGPFMNDTLPITVPAGETNTVVAQTGTGVVDKAGSGLLILQDPGLFNGVVRLREGALHAGVSGATPATRPDTVFARAVFHVDASAASSITADDEGPSRSGVTCAALAIPLLCRPTPRRSGPPMR